MERVDANAAGLERAAQALREGRLVAYLTETFYGLAADPWQPVALERLLVLKGRSSGVPLPLILPSRDHLAVVVDEIPGAALVLMDRYWPGPLTLVLPARPGLPAPLLGPGGVGVRLSPHPVASGLAARLDAPLVATSANPAGEPPAETGDEVAERLPGVDLLVDGGPAAGGAPSTVVAVSLSGELKVLRQGAIHVRG
jgi:L-threonylcarbamoyladenylate synthase